MWTVLVLWWATLPPCRTLTKDVVTVSAVVGQQAELPCNLAPPSNDDGVYLVLWYKDDVAHPIYSIDSRYGGLHVGKHVVSNGYMDRAVFVVDSPARLILQSVTLEDEGRYRCRVDFKVAKTRNRIVLLKLIVPPSKPIIKSQHGEIVDDVVGPYIEGQRLLLICDTDGGDPAPALNWFLASDLLDDTYELMSGDVTRNQLTIPSLDRTHTSTLLSCQATNNNLTLPVTSVVRLSLYLRPSQVTILDDDRPIVANTPDRRRCVAEGSNPPASISWWLETARMTHTEERVSVDGNSTISTVTLVLSGEDHGKMLICRAENPQIISSAIEDSRRLDILFPPELVIRLGNNLRPDNIREEHDVYFDCEIRANPWVSDVSWYFEGHELQTNTTAGVIVTNQTLVLQKVHRSNRGRYSCSAVNSQGRGESRPLTLRIQYTPTCKTSQKSLYGVTKHKMARITCDVEADPIDVTFQWSFNQSREDVGFITFEDRGLQSVATYVPRSDGDYGTLSCTAVNDVGPQLEPCVFFVVPAGPPEPLHNCTVKNETGHSFVVRCFVENRSGLTERYHLEVWDEALQKTVSNESDEQPRFVVKDLPPGRSFTLTAYVSNELGISSRVVLSGVKLAMSDRLTHKGDHWQSRMMPFIAIVISLMVGLLLLAVFVVALFKIRKSVIKKKDSQHPTGNNIPNNINQVDMVVHVPVHNESSWRGFLNIAALWRRRRRASNSQVPQVSLENNSFYDTNHRHRRTGSCRSSTSSVHQTAL